MSTKTALITGSSRGIGAATAELFAEQGYNVVINYNTSKEKAEQVAQHIHQMGAEAMTMQADVSKESEVAALFDAAQDRFGSIDVLVNNAATSAQSLLTDVSTEEWDSLFATNVRGVFLCSREALKDMVSRKEGRIVNVSSVWGITGASCEVCYSSAKAAVIGFTKALAKEVGPSGITVNCLAPGVIDTDMNGDLSADDVQELVDMTPLGRLGSPQEAAAAVLYLASQEAGFITGQVLSPNGGFVV